MARKKQNNIHTMRLIGTIFYFLFSNSLTFQIFSSFFPIEDLWRLLDFYYLWISVDYECKMLTKTKQNRNVCSMQIYEREKEIRSACIWFPGLGDSVPKSSLKPFGKLICASKIPQTQTWLFNFCHGLQTE